MPEMEITIPSFFLCPISLQLMQDPVTLSSGQTFDRSSIEAWLDEGHLFCPLTRQPLSPSEDPIPNHTLRRFIQGWCVANTSKGVQRISTPRPRTTLAEAQLLVSHLTPHSIDLTHLNKLTSMAKIDSRSKKHLLSAGAVPALASCLVALTSKSELGDEILSALAFLRETDASCWNPTLAEVSAIASFIVEDNMDSKLNAALLLNGLELTQETKRMLGEKKGMMDNLVAMIKDELYLKISMAGLKLLYQLVYCVGNRARAAEAGAVAAIVEMLPGAEKKKAELGLCILDALCLRAEGRASFWKHALSIHIIVKLTNSVSEKATEHVLQILKSILTMRTTTNYMKKLAVEAGAVHQLIVAPEHCHNSDSSKKLALQTLKSLSEVVDLSTCFHGSVKL